MHDDETLRVDQDVRLEPCLMVNVVIREYNYGEYWSVQVATEPNNILSTLTTNEGDESFLWHLINAALSGDATAWFELARIGVQPTFNGVRIATGRGLSDYWMTATAGRALLTGPPSG
jgi:hypothetical protein